MTIYLDTHNKLPWVYERVTRLRVFIACVFGKWLLQNPFPQPGHNRNRILVILLKPSSNPIPSTPERLKKTSLWSNLRISINSPTCHLLVFCFCNHTRHVDHRRVLHLIGAFFICCSLALCVSMGDKRPALQSSNG